MKVPKSRGGDEAFYPQSLERGRWSTRAVMLAGSIFHADPQFKAVYVDKRELKCACVEGGSNVPLGFVSLTENVMMVDMALWMLCCEQSLNQLAASKFFPSPCFFHQGNPQDAYCAETIFTRGASVHSSMCLRISKPGASEE